MPGLLELAPAAAAPGRRGQVARAARCTRTRSTPSWSSEGRAGRAVVRLKGGDPFVFGRGGEEALALQAAGVPFEVVPGITSAIAVPAYAGVPVTHRGLATSFTVVTGHSRHAVDRETNWEALAAAGGTIVVLMGVAHREAIADRLMAGGLAPDTPVLAVHWGTRPEQRSGGSASTSWAPRRSNRRSRSSSARWPAWTWTGTSSAPSSVAGWSSPGPGPRPRRCRPASGTSAPVPIEVPTIRIDPPADGGAALDRAARDLAAGRYDWVVFSSANAVEALLAQLQDARSFGPARIAAMGPGTAEALAGWRIVADLVPERSVAEGLLEAFPDPPGTGRPRPAAPSRRGSGRPARRAWRRRAGRSTRSRPTGPCPCP